MPEYLEQSRKVTEEQLALLRYGIRHFERGVFFQHLLGIDQNSHMLWAKHEPELLGNLPAHRRGHRLGQERRSRLLP